MTTWPAPLRPGGRISVWAPSSPGPYLFPKRFRRGIEALRSDGFAVRVTASCRTAWDVSTGTPAVLAAELHEQLQDPECDAVVAAVGGWTLLNVLPHLDFDLIAAAGKPLVGYSDLSVLVNLVGNRAGLVAFHGPMVLSEWGEADGPTAMTRNGFRSVLGLGGPWERHVVAHSVEWSDELLWWDRDDVRPRELRTGGEALRVVQGASDEVVEGVLWGGSLLALALTLGTPWWVPPGEAILFLEAEAIAPDEFAARLGQLRMAGVFDRAMALVLGRIGRPRPTASGYTDYDQVVRRIVPAGLPVVAGYDLGHSTPMVTLPVGGRARLAMSEPELILLGPGG
ncbi:hypothetical protein ALI22I_09585 [Saccharothrix sp. ALI-22-I]|uniref:S66 peptidase family protein n=1 Tax=Saccharothrix sp. ALI-22-I TaxID=1933778 RepID=UPI00097BEEA4|nr:LD-carboxypeptidase [Saccharothrix sp. ALI-22-I]ONI91301.1 hypothetical protein ALI22I_09585 [Saccharothrix sp. ALI-22-I]